MLGLALVCDMAPAVGDPKQASSGPAKSTAKAERRPPPQQAVRATISSVSVPFRAQRGLRSWELQLVGGQPTGVGEYFSRVALILMVGSLVLWMWLCRFVDEDSRGLKVRSEFWNSIFVVTGVVGFLALPTPLFVVGMLSVLLTCGVPFGFYVEERNRRVPESGRILTPKHMRKGVASVGGPRGIKFGGKGRDEIPGRRSSSSASRTSRQDGSLANATSRKLKGLHGGQRTRLRRNSPPQHGHPPRTERGRNGRPPSGSTA